MNIRSLAAVDTQDSLDRACLAIERNSSRGCKCRGLHGETCGFRKLDSEAAELQVVEDWETGRSRFLPIDQFSGNLGLFGAHTDSLSPAEILEAQEEREYQESLAQFEEMMSQHGQESVQKTA